ncbi:MAG: alpha/beta fold hydrolase [Pseudolysinimonas sp.]
MTKTTTTAPVTEFATSRDGTRIAFERAGSGPVLVLIDGALCFREFGPARDVSAHLTDHFTVVIYDRRGRGESGDIQPYAPQREFEDLEAVIAATGGDAYVMGQSSGAGIAYRAAAAGVPMRKLIGYEAPWMGLRAGKDGQPRDYLGELQALLAKNENGKAVGYFMVKMVGGPFFLPLMMRMMPKVWAQLQAVAITLPYDARVMGAQFVAPLAELAAITVPSLVLCGGKSPKQMTAAQVTVAAAIPGAQHRILPGQTHQVSPGALAPVLVEFFSE